MASIGATARDLRRRLQLTQVQLADMLGISTVHLSEVENGKSQPSPTLQKRYRELFGIDLYVMTWAEQGNSDSLPPKLRKAAEQLKSAWKSQVEELVSNYTKNHS